MLIKKDRPRKIVVLPASMSISWWNRMRRTLGLGSYWVRCDGRDDAQAFNEALEFLPKNPGGEVYVAAGTYTPTTGIITAALNTNIRGAGIGNTIIQLNGDGQNYLLSLAQARCTLRDLTLDGNGISRELNNYVLWVNADADHSLVQRVEVKNWRVVRGIAVAGEMVVVANCVIDAGVLGETNGDYGIWTPVDPTGVDGLRVIGNSFENCYKSGAYVTSRQFVVANNYFSGNHIDAAPGGGQIATPGFTFVSTTGIVANNVIESGGGTATSGIEIDGAGVTVEGNAIRDQDNHGIVLQAGDDNLIIGNVIFNCGTDNGPNAAIYVPAGAPDCSGFSIIGNRCWDATDPISMNYGIWIADAQSDNFVVVGNNCCGVKTDGILNAAGVGATKIVANNLECPDP